MRVRVLYDWMGALGSATQRVLQLVAAAGGEVRCVNPLRLDSPLGWLSRDHRKIVAVDEQVGFVSGLCASRKWVGDPALGVEPWRDTGIEVSGPAIADIERAFAVVWAVAGAPLAEEELTDPETVPAAGEVMLRVMATQPTVAALYRLDQLIAAMARHTLWLADAYFVGVALYVQALRAAALDGVDVRLLVPRARATCRSSRRCRGRVTGRCSRPASAYSNGTGPCCTRKPRWPTAAGRGWDQAISTSRAGWETTSLMRP